MKTSVKWVRVVYVVGVIALLIGAIDPMEGSVVIAIGSLLIALATYIAKDRHQKLFLMTMVMILVGVFFLFFLSSLGGFGGKSDLSWWWGLLILPYPVGWIISIILLIKRSLYNRKLNAYSKVI